MLVSNLPYIVGVPRKAASLECQWHVHYPGTVPSLYIILSQYHNMKLHIHDIQHIICMYKMYLYFM